MKIRIIKEESVYRIQEFHTSYWDGQIINSFWEYASKAMDAGKMFKEAQPMDFKTQKEAEDFVEHNYVVDVVKEYEVK